MSDTEIRVILSMCCIFICLVGGLVYYLLGMAKFLMERIGHTEDRVNEDAAAIYTLIKALQRITARIDKLEGLK